MRNIIKGEKHFTASVWLLTKSTPKKVLLLYHKKFDLWLQPGGHLEHFENPLEAAVREVKEETGVDIGFLKKNIQPADDVAVFLPLPDYFLEERIPAHGDQPEHFHLDHMYIVEVDEQAVVRSMKESDDIGWFTKKEALGLPIFENTKRIIEKILS